MLPKTETTVFYGNNIFIWKQYFFGKIHFLSESQTKYNPIHKVEESVKFTFMLNFKLADNLPLLNYSESFE